MTSRPTDGASPARSVVTTVYYESTVRAALKISIEKPSTATPIKALWRNETGPARHVGGAS